MFRLLTCKRSHDATLIAVGSCKARRLQMPGCGLDGVIPAMEYLTASNRKGLGDDVGDFSSGRLNAAHKKVVVVGGGDTAMDCVRTAVRQEAAEVVCLYRRDRDNVPGSRREIGNAMEEGVSFAWLSAPEAVLGTHGANGMRVHKMALGLPDATGRKSFHPVPDSSFSMRADMIVEALGFVPEDLQRIFECPALPITSWDTVRCDFRDMSTSIPRVYVAGDVARGASLVVWAIRDGRVAAEKMDRDLRDPANIRRSQAA